MQYANTWLVMSLMHMFDTLFHNPGPGHQNVVWTTHLKSLMELQIERKEIVDAQKSFNHYLEGLKDEFKVNDNLQAFQNHLWVHLEETGMDTITCVPDPETNEMVNVVLDHARFTVDMVATKVTPQLRCYDE